MKDVMKRFEKNEVLINKIADDIKTDYQYSSWKDVIRKLELDKKYSSGRAKIKFMDIVKEFYHIEKEGYKLTFTDKCDTDAQSDYLQLSDKIEMHTDLSTKFQIMLCQSMLKQMESVLDYDYSLIMSVGEKIVDYNIVGNNFHRVNKYINDIDEDEIGKEVKSLADTDYSNNSPISNIDIEYIEEYYNIHNKNMKRLLKNSLFNLRDKGIMEIQKGYRINFKAYRSVKRVKEKYIDNQELLLNDIENSNKNVYNVDYEELEHLSKIGYTDFSQWYCSIMNGIYNGWLRLKQRFNLENDIDRKHDALYNVDYRKIFGAKYSYKRVSDVKQSIKYDIIHYDSIESSKRTYKQDSKDSDAYVKSLSKEELIKEYDLLDKILIKSSVDKSSSGISLKDIYFELTYLELAKVIKSKMNINGELIDENGDRLDKNDVIIDVQTWYTCYKLNIKKQALNHYTWTSMRKLSEKYHRDIDDYNLDYMTYRLYRKFKIDSDNKDLNLDVLTLGYFLIKDSDFETIDKEERIKRIEYLEEQYNQYLIGKRKRDKYKQMKHESNISDIINYSDSIIHEDTVRKMYYSELYKDDIRILLKSAKKNIQKEKEKDEK